MNHQLTLETDFPIEIDEIKLQRFIREIRDNQNLSMGIIGGVIAAAMGAAIWAVVTVVTNFPIGWMAICVGFLVGFSVRKFGNGLDTSFGIAGAGLSLLGCLAGNLLTICILGSRQESIPIFNLFSQLNPVIAVNLMKATFSPIDLLFYGIAVYEGYKFSFKTVTEEELERMAK
jgi:hypothetical protein